MLHARKELDSYLIGDVLVQRDGGHGRGGQVRAVIEHGHVGTPLSRRQNLKRRRIKRRSQRGDVFTQTSQADVFRNICQVFHSGNPRFLRRHGFCSERLGHVLTGKLVFC